ncbi:MAG: outer membrane beta-barrel protein [Bacteroidetes bacterium]|nr:outer membrane beta-barrel protein [Bacteroidota bacterium]
MNKVILNICLLLFVSKFNAQSIEFGMMGGVSNYMGDLSDLRIRINQTHPATGISVRYNPDRYISLRGSFLYGTISGADSFSKNANHRLRNLSFQSNIYDFNTQIEWNLKGFCFGDYNNKYGFSPYLAAGINIFKFNPKAYYRGHWYELQPLGTEGQGTTDFQDRKTYELTQFSLSLSAGLKFRFTDNWNMVLEYGLRNTFTDQLDDVSGNTYVDPEILKKNTANDNPTWELSDRSFEVNRGKSVGTDDAGKGIMRGNKNTPIDWFMFLTLSICYRFPVPGVNCTSY